MRAGAPPGTPAEVSRSRERQVREPLKDLTRRAGQGAAGASARRSRPYRNRVEKFGKPAVLGMLMNTT